MYLDKNMYFIYLFLIIYIAYTIARLSRGITRSSTCLLGKTAIVTGANSGIGYQTALNLASRGCKVIMADVTDMTKSKNDIISYSNNPNIYTKKIDLSSLTSVREFAQSIREEEESLHILVNNAGIGASRIRCTEDGLHPVLQVNYFGPFLLTHLLVDVMKKSAPARIVFTSSVGAFLSNLTPESLRYKNDTDSLSSSMKVYNNSKLALLIASDIFAEKLEGTGVTSNSIHPGIVRTLIFSKMISEHQNWFNNFVGFCNRMVGLLFHKDSWEGSQVLVHVAVSKKLEKVTGKHFWDCKSFWKPLEAYNKDLCKKIWEITEECVGLRVEERL